MVFTSGITVILGTRWCYPTWSFLHSSLRVGVSWAARPEQFVSEREHGSYKVRQQNLWPVWTGVNFQSKVALRSLGVIFFG